MHGPLRIGRVALAKALGIGMGYAPHKFLGFGLCDHHGAGCKEKRKRAQRSQNIVENTVVFSGSGGVVSDKPLPFFLERYVGLSARGRLVGGASLFR